VRLHIDTIPVWDAYGRDSECPLCDLHAANEQACLESFLGASVMEPDVRVEVNAKGFCGHHFERMFAMQNRLGLALMTHTHLKETMASFPRPALKKRGLFRKKEAAAQTGGTCVLCERLGRTMERYLYTVPYLWTREKDFQRAFAESKGVCLPHYRGLCDMAARALSAAEAGAFLAAIEALQRENMARIEKELEWFTLKFDYRNADKPWGNSKDALERAIHKLRGAAGINELRTGRYGR